MSETADGELFGPPVWSRTTLPPGLVTWDQAIRDPLQATPWPYTAEEFATIRAALPTAAHNTDALAYVLRLALTYTRSRVMPARRPSKKHSPRKEIEGLRVALEGVIEAARRVSPPAIEHLQEASPRTALPSLIAGIIANARGLLALNGFHDLPPATRQGTKTDHILARLVVGCDDIWRALPGGRPHKGFPAFRNAVCLPLGTVHLSKNGWEDALRRGRALQVEAQKKRTKSA